MKPVLATILLFTWLGLCAPLLQAQFYDDFSNHQPGSTGAPVWQIASGFWLMEDSSFVERSGIYDAAAFAPIYLDSDAELVVHFRQRSSYKGAGLLFCSENTQSPAFAHMVRLDDTRLLQGYFAAGHFQATRVLALPAPVQDTRWHQLRVRLAAIEGTYTVWLDGEQIGAPQRLRYRSGYAGLQNSGGHAEFADFRISTGAAAPGRPQWPVALAVAGAGIWTGSPATGSVGHFDFAGKLRHTLLPPAAPKPQFAPMALTLLADGGIAVLDSLHRRILLYHPDGAYRATLGGTLKRPVDLTSTGESTLIVSDAGAGKLIEFDLASGNAATIPWPAPIRPVLLAAGHNRLAFVDTRLNRIHLLERDGEGWREVSEFAAPAGELRGMALAPASVLLAVDNAVVKLSHRGKVQARQDFAVLGGVHPQRLAVQGKALYIADFAGGRVVHADTSLQVPELAYSFAGDGTLALKWRSPVRNDGWVRLFSEGQLPRTVPARRAGDHFVARVTGLPPSRLYQVEFAPHLATLPADTTPARQQAIMTPPPAGTMAYMEIPAAVLLFANVIDSANVQPDWPAIPPLDTGEIERIRAQFDDARYFYWMNSGMRLHLALDFFVIDSLHERGAIFGDAWYYPPRDGIVERVLANAGADSERYTAIFFIAAVRDFGESRQRWVLRGRGGGFTTGIGGNWRHGISWWEATAAGHAAGNNWLAVHEFHHQLDELFLHSGYPDYWFNHFAPVAGTAAKFGEHFDGNAYILRQWPPDRWFALRSGALQHADDRDMDGIPDDAPHLPNDEKRLGSDPNKRDSDGDGLGDLDEVRRSNWVVEGQGEQAQAAQIFPRLDHPDSDGDGLDDSIDPWPLYPWSPAIPHQRHGVFQRIGASSDARAPATIDATWSSDSLYFRFVLPANRRLRVLLDAGADGWFTGRDNFEFRLDTSDSLRAQVRLFDASQPGRWPQMEPALAAGIRFAWQRMGDMYQLAIARQPQLGLYCEAGETIGVSVAIDGEAPNSGRYISVYEPNRFFDIVLRH